MNINLRGYLSKQPRTKRRNKAIRYLREQVYKATKASEIKIDPELNKRIANQYFKTMSKISIAIEYDNNKANVYSLDRFNIIKAERDNQSKISKENKQKQSNEDKEAKAAEKPESKEKKADNIKNKEEVKEAEDSNKKASENEKE